MNDTIARLFHQSGGNIRTVNGATWTYTDEGFDMEKFAKLIVQECASLLENTTADKRLNLSPELFKLINNIGKAQSEYICKHFGVE